MTKILSAQNNFTIGEISPRLFGQTNSDVYVQALETATNCTVTPHGPIKRRNGTKFISQAKSVESDGNDQRVRLLRFQFSASDAFVIEMGDPESGSPYMRFYQNSGQVTETADTITGITQASPAVVTTSSAHGFSTGDNVYITGVTGMTEINRPNAAYQVGSVTSTTFEVLELGGGAINSTGFTAYSAGGEAAKIYEIVSPYDITDIDEISYVQFGNVIYMAHPDYEPRKLTRNSATDWTIETIEFSPPPTVELGYEPDTTCTPAATTGTSVNFTAGAATWLQADVGRQIVNNSSGEDGKAIITSITSSTVAVCDIIEDFTDTNAIASGDWKLDLSPIAELEFSGTAAGSIVTVTSNYPVGFKGATKAISGITAANPAVITSTSHGLSAGTPVFITDVEGMTEINGRTLTGKTVAANTLTMTDGSGTNFNASNFSAYSTGGTIQQVFTDVKADCFRSDDVGKFILANDGVLKILELVSATEVKCEVLKGLSSKDNSENWTLEVEDWTAARGYPRAVGLFQERLVFGGTSSKPTTLYFSETGIFEGMGVGSLDSDAIIIDVSSKEVNQINWLANSRDLVVGTAGSELTVSAPSASTGLSASNIEIQTRTYHGSLAQTPVTIGTEIVFNQGTGKKVRTFRYDFNLDGYKGEDINFFAEHMLDGTTIKEIAYSQEPDNNIYAVLNNGDMIVCTYERERKVIGWCKYTTDGSFENVQVISNGTTDEVWVSVKRTINSNVFRYVELFDNGVGTDRLDGFSDSYLTYSSPTTITGITKADPAVVTSTAHGLSDGDRVKLIDVGGMTEVEGISFLVANKTANTFELTNLQGTNIDSTTYTTYTSGGEAHKLVNSVSGLDHLEGESVEVKVDGTVTANLTVSSGAVTLDDYYYEVTIGMPYTTTIKTLKKEFDVGRGTMQGQKSRYIRPVLRLYQSTLPLVDGNFMPSRSGNDEMNQAVPLFSGDLEFGNLNFGTTGQVEITVSEPLPLQLSGIFGSFEGNIK